MKCDHCGLWLDSRSRTKAEAASLWNTRAAIAIAPASPAALQDEADPRIVEITNRLDFSKAGPTWYGQQEFPLREALTDARYLLIALERLSRASAPTPPSTLARKAAEQICRYFGDAELAMNGPVNADGVATIIERCFSAEGNK